MSEDQAEAASPWVAYAQETRADLLYNPLKMTNQQDVYWVGFLCRGFAHFSLQG